MQKITPKYWRQSSLKTVDITGRKWFDSVNGNTYCSCVVIINFGLKNEWSFSMPLTYGYGSFYRQMAIKVLKIHGVLPDKCDFNLTREDNIVINDYCYPKGLKRDCKLHGLSQDLVINECGDIEK